MANTKIHKRLRGWISHFNQMKHSSFKAIANIPNIAFP